MILVPLITLTFITLIAVIYKTVLFTKNLRYKKLKHWFYLSQYRIMTSRSEKSLQQRELQNKLTLLIIALGMLDVVFLFFTLMVQG